MAADGVDTVKFLGRVESFTSIRNGVISCPEAHQMWGQDVYGYKDILDKLGVQVGDSIRFGIHVNSKGQPQVSMPAWRVGPDGEPIGAEGVSFLKAEEVLGQDPDLRQRLKEDIEEASRRPAYRKRPRTSREDAPGGPGRQDGAAAVPSRGGKAKGKGAPRTIPPPKRAAAALPGQPRPAATAGPGGATPGPSADEVDQGMLLALATTAKEPAISPVILVANYTIQCDFPSDKVELMQGASGEHLKAIQMKTGAKLRFDELGDEDGLCRLVMEGPLLGLYQAHALMMGRYHEASRVVSQEDELGYEHRMGGEEEEWEPDEEEEEANERAYAGRSRSDPAPRSTRDEAPPSAEPRLDTESLRAQIENLQKQISQLHSSRGGGSATGSRGPPDSGSVSSKGKGKSSRRR